MGKQHSKRGLGVGCSNSLCMAFPSGGTEHMRRKLDRIDEFVAELNHTVGGSATIDDYAHVEYVWHNGERMDIIYSVELEQCDCIVYNPFADDELERELDAREDDRTIRRLRSRG